MMEHALAAMTAWMLAAWAALNLGISGFNWLVARRNQKTREELMEIRTELGLQQAAIWREKELRREVHRPVQDLSRPGHAS